MAQEKGNKDNNESKPENSFFESSVPQEIDTHLQLYGKHMWEVNYTEKCPRCNKRIDEFGYCACNGFAE